VSIEVLPGTALPLVSLTEIGRRAGVRKAAVGNWVNRYDDFPEPVAKLQCGPIFWWPHVEAWLRDTGRL
jgi:hypothetical protein